MPIPATWLWTGALLAVAAAVGASLPALLGALRTLGRYVPQEQIERDYLVGLIWAVLIGLSIRFWPIRTSDRRHLLVIWAAKVVVTLGVMLVYEWNYSLDAYGYYQRSVLQSFPEFQSYWSLGSVTVARVAWVQAQLLPDSYHAVKVTFAAMGLVAVYLIYRGAVAWWPGAGTHLLYWLGLFPSILFWSSILGKEPVQLLGIAFYVYGVLSWRATGRARYLVPIAAGVGLAMLIRSWSGLILMFPLVVFAVMGVRRPGVRVLVTAGALLVFGWTVQRFADTFRIETLRDVQTAAETRSRGWEGGSAQHIKQDFSSPGKMLAFAPVGAFTALFRPLPGEVRNAFGIVAGLENAFLLALVVIAAARTRWRELRDPVLVWAIALIVTWSLMYGFVSSYNFGAAVRFKLQILPALLLVLLFMARGGARVRADGRSTTFVREPTARF